MFQPLDLGTTLGQGDRPGRRQVRLFELEGNHYEKGYQQGLQAREVIHHFFAHLHQWETFMSKKPFLVPFRLYTFLATRRAVADSGADLAEYYPNQKERMEGIAKGAVIEESLLFLALMGEMMMTEVDYRLGACTAAAVSPERSAVGEPVVIKNFDYPVFFQPYYLTRLCRSPEGISTLEVTIAPLAGCHDGINDRGLCITCNHGYGTDMPSVNVPVTVLVQEALESCASTREAVEFICRGKRGNGAILLVADAGGDVACVELSPGFCGVREPEDGVIIATNNYRSREMISYDIPRNAYYTGRNVRAFRGLRVHESSELRYARVEQLLSAMESVTVKDLLGVFCDHGESGRGDDNTVCRHGPYLSTTRSVIMFPRSRRLLVTYGHPCESVFTDFHNPFASGDEGKREEDSAAERTATSPEPGKDEP